MVKAKVLNIDTDNKIKYFTLQEAGTGNIRRYSEREVYDALGTGLIEIKYLRRNPSKPFEITIDNGYYMDKIHKIDAEQPVATKKAQTKKKAKPRKGSKAEQIEKLNKAIRHLELQIQHGRNVQDNRDKIIVKKRELCRLKGIEADVGTNIYTHVYNPRKHHGYTKL